METTGNVAIVTGGGSGLGRYFAEGLAAVGARVIVADVDAEAAAETADRIGGRAVHADIAEADDLRRLARIAEDEGGPHILVNNAGAVSRGGRQYPASDPAAWNAVIDLNLRAPMLLTQLCLEPMARLGGGAVLNIASSAGVGEEAHSSPEYATTKAGLIRFSSSLSDLEETHKVRIACIVPDWVGLDRAYGELAALPADQREKTPPLIAPGEIVEVGLELIRSGRCGTVVEMWGGQPPLFRTPGDLPG